MNRRNNKKIIITTLCAIVIGMVVGYAALNQLLSIKGTSQISGDFNIQITNIEENTMTNSKTISTSGLGTTTANFTVDLEKPGSSAIYNVTVENKGTIDAVLKNIEGLDEANAKSPTDIKFSTQSLDLNEELVSKQSKTFQVKVEWLGTSTSVPETNKTLNLKLNYEQKTSSSSTEGTLVTKVNELLANSSATYSYMDGTYLGGRQNSNYVWFDGFMWRIMGVNADGSVRLITEEEVTAIPWGTENTVDYDASYVNDWLNNYFYPKLKDKDLIVNTTWCSETTTDGYSQRTTCTNNLSTQIKPVGLISIDEYNLSLSWMGYLVNNLTFWTLTPDNTSKAWFVNIENPDRAGVNPYSFGVRPVISVSSEINFTGGTGTLTDPYMIEDKMNDTTGTLKDHSYTGEYVTYAGRNYRVVETSDAGTKLILDGYYDTNNNGTIDTSEKFQYDENRSGGCTLCTKINEDLFINWITNNNSNDASKLVSTTWYRGAYWTGGDYKINLSSTENPYTGKVGLIRIGETLSGQLGLDNPQSYWTGTPKDSTYVWIVWDNGSTTGDRTIVMWYGVRPVIMISPNTTITGGNGTPNSPYQI